MEEGETESGSNVSEYYICQLNRISHTLTSAPHIVQNILCYLNARQLSACARVCKLWSDTVKVLRPMRQTLSWTCINCSERGDAVHQAVKDFIHTLYTEPSVLFMFCQTDLYDNPIRISSPTPSHRSRTRYSRASKKPKAQIGEYVKSLLPARCELVGVTTDGIVGTSIDLSTMYEYESKKAISFLSLPKLDGVEVEVFTVDVYEAVLEHIDIHLLSPVSNEKDVKLMLFLSDNPDWSDRLGYMMLKHYPQTAIAGGYVDNLVVPKPCHFTVDGASEPPLPSLICVAFSGPKLQVATIVVRETVHSADAFEKEVKRLKNCNLSEKNSFAFMFACVGRGNGLYEENDVETTIFKKYFPKTPLVGFFGNGEIGFDWFPNMGQDMESVEQARREMKMFHAYTTILCLISLV